jgi:hypothetical protein
MKRYDYKLKVSKSYKLGQKILFSQPILSLQDVNIICAEMNHVYSQLVVFERFYHHRESDVTFFVDKLDGIAKGAKSSRFAYRADLHIESIIGIENKTHILCRPMSVKVFFLEIGAGGEQQKSRKQQNVTHSRSLLKKNKLRRCQLSTTGKLVYVISRLFYFKNPRYA